MPRKQKKPVNPEKAKHGNRHNTASKLAIKAQLDAGISAGIIAKQHNVSERTVYRVRDDKELGILKNGEVAEVKKGITNLSYIRSLQSLHAITPNKLERSSAVQNMVIGKIGLEMGRLMEDKSTSNIAIHEVHDYINKKIADCDAILGNVAQ